jgi:hypothetical protein
MNKIKGGLKNAIIGSKTIAKGWHNNQYPGMFLKLYKDKLYVYYDERTRDVVEEYEGQCDFAIGDVPVDKYTIEELKGMF